MLRVQLDEATQIVLFTPPSEPFLVLFLVPWLSASCCWQDKVGRKKKKDKKSKRHAADEDSDGSSP